jgi:hypothetical protein
MFAPIWRKSIYFQVGHSVSWATRGLGLIPAHAYDWAMVLIRFPNPEAKKRALGYLAGRFSFKSWATGEMIVPETALPELAMESIPYSVEGPAKYEQHVPSVRNPPATAV